MTSSDPEKPKKPKRETIEVEVEGRPLTLSNQGKVLYREAGSQVLERVKKVGDLFAPALTLMQPLPAEPRATTKKRAPRSRLPKKEA